MRGKPDQFDPYYKWLGIPSKDQPPTLYRLLGVELFESDAEVIDVAANRQMAYLQSCSAGEYSDLAERLLNEVAAARLCLLNPKKKSAYDAGIRATTPKDSTPILTEFESSKWAYATATQASVAPQPITSPLEQLANASHSVRKIRKSPVQSHYYWVFAVLLSPPVMIAAVWFAMSRSGSEVQPSLNDSATKVVVQDSSRLAVDTSQVRAPDPTTAVTRPDTSNATSIPPLIVESPTRIGTGDPVPIATDDHKTAGTQPTTSSSTPTLSDPHQSQPQRTVAQCSPNPDRANSDPGSHSFPATSTSQPSTKPVQKHDATRAPSTERLNAKLVWTPLRDSKIICLVKGEAHIFQNGAQVGDVKTSFAAISAPLRTGDIITIQTKSQFAYRFFRIGFMTDDGISTELSDVRFLGSAEPSNVNARLVTDAPHSAPGHIDTHFDKEWPDEVLGRSSTANSIPQRDMWFTYAVTIPETNHLGLRKLLGKPLRSTINSIGMKFVEIQPGTFLMGSPENETGRSDNEVQHKVTLTKHFAMADTAVTQSQWKAVMGSNPSHFIGDDLPAETVTYENAEEFCKRLSEKERQTYRLPTEAEWEYCCRAGTTTAYSDGDSEKALSAVGWYRDNSDHKTHPVAQRKPNLFGLYDMHGNVCQWCSDWFERYSPDDVTNPSGPEHSNDRILRGGAWYSTATFCRSACRRVCPNGKSDRYDGIGLRVVLNVNDG